MGQSTAAAARARARRRNRENIKRSAVSDITAEQELAMRLKARNCPLCGTRMRSEGGKPDSRELDHIVPIVIGGTHTHGNVRIICRRCNQRRPKDGSDYDGPVTLWAQGPSPVRRPRKQYAVNMVTCRKGLHPWVGSNIKVTPSGQRRCAACERQRDRSGRPSQAKNPKRRCECGAMFVVPGRTLMCPGCTEKAGRKAAELHAAGGMTWGQVAAEVGYTTAEGARYAAKRIGYAPVRPESAVKPERQCRCGESPYRHGRCRDCIAAAAAKAATLRGYGWTLRMIADDLGYTSITSVTNLLKTADSA